MMESALKSTPVARHGVGRPRRGTEQQREQGLIDAATRVFLRAGFASSSIQKVAIEAGVSTRTIYERFRNKGELLGAVVSRLVENDLTSVMSATELNRLSLKDALLTIGRTITARITSPTVGSLLRLLVSEGQKFPALAQKMRERTKDRIDDAVEQYLRVQIGKGTLRLSDPGRGAALFTQMIHGDFKDGALFGTVSDVSRKDLEIHVTFVVELFLTGALPRNKSRTQKKQH